MSDGRSLLDEEYTGARMSRCEELAEVCRHGLEVVRDQNAPLLGGQSQHVGVSDAIQARDLRREKINRWFAA
jgi:hypothetical protein